MVSLRSRVFFNVCSVLRVALVSLGMLVVFSFCFTRIGHVSAQALSQSRTAFCGEPSLSIGSDPPPVKARLGILKSRIEPNQEASIRIENLGSKTIGYGYSYRLALKKGSRWVNQPVGPFYAIRISTETAKAGPCQPVRLRGDLASGLYRVSKQVWRAEAGPSSAKTVSATFRVD